MASVSRQTPHRGAMSSSTLVVVVCAAYAVAGPAIILVNKHILSDLNFPFPYSLTCMGLATSSLFSTILVQLGLVECRNKATVTSTFYVKRVLPIGAFQALAMGFGTVAYLSLTVAFIQMLKAFTPVITLVIVYIFGVETPSRQIVVAVAAISIGTFLAVLGEVQLDLFGTVIHEVSAVAEGIRLVLMQVLLQQLRFSPVEGLYYMAPAGTLCMLVMVATFEATDMSNRGALDTVRQHWQYFALASTLGFGLNLLSFWIIQLTSSVMLKIISVARTAALVLWCAVFLHEKITSLEIIGYTISLVAFAVYNRHQ
eukprot:m.315563 g.315563  ORF g.315563 m.315563 type:complete len:313 (+) comp27525_c0_seq1:327-1265(+)